MAAILTHPQKVELCTWKRKLDTRKKVQQKEKELALERFVNDLSEPEPVTGFINQGKRGN